MKRREAALRLIGVGWYIGFCIVLGVWGGRWLDNKFGTGPVLVIVGLLLGLMVAGYGVYQMLLPLIRERNNKRDE